MKITTVEPKTEQDLKQIILEQLWFREYYMGIPDFEEIKRLSCSNVNLITNDNDIEKKVEIPYPENHVLLPLLENTARQLFEIYEPTRLHIDEISVMRNCTTNPLKISISANSSHKEIFYLKNGNPKRYFGIMLYNALLNREKIKFITDTKTLAMAEVKGLTLEDLRYEHYDHCQKFYKDLARLEVFLNLILLNDITSEFNQRNIVINNHKINVIDFDQAFTLGSYNFHQLTGKLPRTTYIEEKENEKIAIWQNYKRNQQYVDRILDILDINRDLANKMGYDTMGQVIKKRLESFAK
jgi:hypothetical protein